MKCLLYLGRTRSQRFSELFEDSDEVDILVPEVSGFMDNFRNFFLLDRTIKAGSYDAVLVDCSGFLAAHVAVLSKLHRVPSIFRVRGDFETEYRDYARASIRAGRMSEWLNHVIELHLTRAVLNMFDLFLPVSDYMGRRLGEIARSRRGGPFLPRTVTFHNSSEDLLDTYRLDKEGARDVLVVTNLNFPEKVRPVLDHMEDLVRLLEAHPELRLRIATVGQGFDGFRERILEAVNGRVEVSVEHDVRDMASVYRGSRILVYLSYFDAFPNTVIEAQSAGVPVVSTKCCGMLEQIEHGRTGLFIGEDGGLVEQCESLLSDEGSYQNMRRMAHEHCRESYSRESRRRLLRKVVEDLGGGGPS